MMIIQSKQTKEKEKKVHIITKWSGTAVVYFYEKHFSHSSCVDKIHSVVLVGFTF